MILPAGVSAFRTPVQLPGMNYGESHFLNGFTWPYINSKDKQYDTTLTSNGWVVIVWVIISTTSVSILLRYMKR